MSLLVRRYTNEPHVELSNAAAEQMKITEMRMQSMFGGTGAGGDAARAGGGGAASSAQRRAGQVHAHLVGRQGVLCRCILSALD